MKRRHFILTPFLFAVGNSFANPQPCLDYFANSLTPDTQELLQLLQSPHAAAVGKQYLLDNPALANEHKLKCAVGLRSELAKGSAKHQFEAQKMLDFETGNIQCIDGWVLSNAEVSLCALAAMITLKN